MEMNNIQSMYKMKLNSNNHSDKIFDDNIKFVVEKYIHDEVPEQIKCKNLHETIIEAYKLFLNDELHGIGLYDSNNNYNGTDALNHFVPTNTNTLCEDIRKLEENIELYKEFIEYTRQEDLYKEFLEYKKNKNK